MVCQNCQKNLASVHFTQIINNNKVEMYLCDHCANEKGHIGFDLPLSIEGFLSGLIGSGSAETHTVSEHREIHCQTCGMSYEDFRSTGKLGCDSCYRIFRTKLNPVLKRIHGNTEHTGKMPEKISRLREASEEIGRLKDTLTKAVREEEYEKAAEIRDKIKKIESGRG